MTRLERCFSNTAKRQTPNRDRSSQKHLQVEKRTGGWTERSEAKAAEARATASLYGCTSDFIHIRTVSHLSLDRSRFLSPPTHNHNNVRDSRNDRNYDEKKPPMAALRTPQAASSMHIAQGWARSKFHRSKEMQVKHEEAVAH
jgi:hypothetical protein